MTSPPTVSPERAMRAIVSQKLGARLISAVPLGGGWSNRGLLRVRVGLGGETGVVQEVVVKLARVFGSPVTDDHDQARIYAARSWNLWPVHALLCAHGLPTYELLAAGFPSAEIPYFWQA